MLAGTGRSPSVARSIERSIQSDFMVILSGRRAEARECDDEAWLLGWREHLEGFVQ